MMRQVCQQPQPHKLDPSDSLVFIHVQVSVQTANNSPPREAGAHPRTGVCVESLASVKVHESPVEGGHNLPFRACSSGKCMMCLILLCAIVLDLFFYKSGRQNSRCAKALYGT